VDELLSEKEQIDKMRAWWSDYGAFVIGGIAVGALGFFGLNYYNDSQRETYFQASALYGDLADLVVDGDIPEAEVVAGQLSTDYGHTNYATQSKLLMARLYMDQNRDEDAAASLNELLAMDVDEGFKDVARIRLARVYLYQDRAQDVVDLVEGREDGAFAQRYAEVLGDAYVALGRTSDARDAYERALLDNGQGSTVDPNFVQLKLLDLPEPTEAFFGTTGEIVEDESGAADAAGTSDDAGTPESDEATE
jgi:predicted negative regulator of RcsB-dependent stress response